MEFFNEISENSLFHAISFNDSGRKIVSSFHYFVQKKQESFLINCFFSKESKDEKSLILE